MSCYNFRNSAYSSLLMSKEKHTGIIYVRDSYQARVKVNNPRFKALTELDNDVYEIETSKKHISLDLPIQLGFFILQYAKQCMLEFYCDFLDVYVGRDNFEGGYVGRDDFEGGQMDTGSFYFGLSSSSLEGAILPQMRQAYEKNVHRSCSDMPFCPDASSNFLLRQCCAWHAKFDQRTPGLFKTEFTGDILVSLCSKMYACASYANVTTSDQAQDKFKFSSKGLSKSALETTCNENQCNTVELYRRVLNSGQASGSVNMGFRLYDNQMMTYRQRRQSIGYFYVKRKVLPDRRSTEPLDITLKLKK